MDKTTIPTKEIIREWLKREVKQHRPPPNPVQIRDELAQLEMARRENS